jgi:2-phospho-L-lactate guanylyltransferase
MEPTNGQRITVIVPVGVLEGAKSRLGESLDAEERRDLVTFLLRRTLEILRQRDDVDPLVVSPDSEVLAIADAGGVATLRQQGQGLNQGLREARDVAIARGAAGLIVLPIDLPLLSIDALGEVVEPLFERSLERPATDSSDRASPVVVIVPDRVGRGTNALGIAPADAMEFCFGGDSRSAHAGAARAIGARLVELTDSPMTLDLDTAEDLLLVEELAPEAVGAG